MANASSPRPMTKRRGSGTSRGHGPSQSCSKVIPISCGARRSAPTANASSPRPGTTRRGSGTSQGHGPSQPCWKVIPVSVLSAAFSPDGNRVVTASDDHTARVWDLSGPRPVATVLEGHTESRRERGVQPRRQPRRHRVQGPHGAGSFRAFVGHACKGRYSVVDPLSHRSPTRGTRPANCSR